MLSVLKNKTSDDLLSGLALVAYERAHYSLGHLAFKSAIPWTTLQISLGK
jgi:hypothetical protein